MSFNDHRHAEPTGTQVFIRTSPRELLKRTFRLHGLFCTEAARPGGGLTRRRCVLRHHGPWFEKGLKAANRRPAANHRRARGARRRGLARRRAADARAGTSRSESRMRRRPVASRRVAMGKEASMIQYLRVRHLQERRCPHLQPFQRGVFAPEPLRLAYGQPVVVRAK
jgi:hypothetical protein